MTSTQTDSCPLCALRRTPSDVTGLGWSSQHEADGSVTWICPTCTRDQLWRIEALLGIGPPSPQPSAPPIAPTGSDPRRPAA